MPEPIQPPSSTDPAWYGDPFGRYERRWWDGERWTEKVTTSGVTSIDPPGIDTAPTRFLGAEPAAPIEDAHLPIRPPPAAPQLALVAGFIVLAAIFALIIVILIVGV